MSDDQLPEAVDPILGWIADYCGYVAEILYSDSRLQEELFARLQAARKEIAKAKSKSRLNLEVALNNAIFEVHRVHARMSKEQEFIDKKSKLLWISPILASVYFVMIILIIIIGWKSNLGSTEIPLIGIPLAVLLWSLIGSINTDHPIVGSTISKYAPGSALGLPLAPSPRDDFRPFILNTCRRGYCQLNLMEGWSRQKNLIESFSFGRCLAQL